MAEVGNAVGDADNPPLKGARHPLSRMVQDAVFYGAREVQPPTAALQNLDHAQTLLVVGKMPRQLRHDRFARMSKRRVPYVMTECNRLGQILVEAQPTGDRARDLRDFETVRHARAIVVARDDVNLRLMLEAPK